MLPSSSSVLHVEMLPQQKKTKVDRTFSMTEGTQGMGNEEHTLGCCHTTTVISWARNTAVVRAKASDFLQVQQSRDRVLSLRPRKSDGLVRMNY